MRKIYSYNLLVILIFAGFTYRPIPVYGYSVLTHEAIIDACWDKNIQPLIVIKFPGATAQQLTDARAYAYGGCVVPDMGYYPFGSKLFTELVHYVRTGDFVTALIAEAQDVNEYAFALGCLCHYNADKYGHPLAINRAVPLIYAKDKEKYGTSVTYEQHPVSHVRTEFGFDVLQTAKGMYANEAYHAFIGFKLSRPVLERAFIKTYGIDINDIFKDLSLSIESFRWIIRNFFPTITRAAWAAKKSEIRQSNPSITRGKFEYRMRTAKYYHEFGKRHERPGFFPATISLVVKILPKVGVLKDLTIKVPGPEAEKLFIQSFDTVSVHYIYSLNVLAHSKYHRFANIDFDTGHETSAGEYQLADKNYIELLLALKKNNYKNVNAELKENILAFYAQCNEGIAAAAGEQQWKNVTEALTDLKSVKTQH
ncbi:MAG: hypothetical protein JWM28_1901 [Chitinophagaceae bacterium]|nr:hypothetical protein [Chitinophagaceae bacterium]